MDSIKNILTKFDPIEDKYISREFQTFGIYLAEKLEDSRHKSLYIKLSRDIPRAILEEALRFCVDSKARSKGALFMWKLKELGALKDKAKGAKKTTKKKTEKI
ncbi:MAG: hypothetical protein ACEQSA_02645 [Weeksellaceae bacterium]